jgi:hypothetical protein
MRMVKSLLPALLIASLFSTLAYAQTPDRISGPIDSSRMVPLFGNIQGPSRPGSDLGRADGGRLIEGISLDFRLSPAQQKDLDQFLAQLGDRSSPNYHKYLKIPQYARRFGMSQNDVDKVVAWIEAQGFTNIKVSPTRNQISFDGTVAQIESAFALEMHHYLVDGEVHLANAMNPSLPAALAGTVQHVGHLHDFAPKPRLKVKPNLTSYVSGSHYLSPADFATIYDLNALYTANATRPNQKIAIVGQSTVNATDLSNFRSAALLPTSTVTMTRIPATSTDVRCSGDEGESDLDLEWSGGVAKNASVIFVYAGVNAGESCTSRAHNIWDALQYALETPVAPFVSTSYGYCEQGMQAQDPGFAATIQTWVQAGQTHGVTLVSASGDSGAADCDPSSSTSATGGLAVDVPAAIPETTGAGGNEFFGDAAGVVTGNTAAADLPYWSASGAGSDAISSALEYIPEEAWNDTIFNIANHGGFAASGGGASVGVSVATPYGFAKPTWQNVTGVPADGKRDVPDISMTASADHDGYLFCSEDGPGGTIVSTCTSGFRTGAGGTFTIVGGTSAAAPTFTAIVALVNQYLGNTPPTGLAPINPTLYSLYPNNATSKAFHDVTTGNNIVPCTSGTPNCPTGTTDFGFNAGVGYDQVTGLGSVDGFNLAQAWAATLAGFTLAPSPASVTAVAGQNTGSATITITPQNGFTGNVTFTCSAGLPSGATCVFTTINATSSSLVIQTSANMAAASNIAVTVKGSSGAVSSTTTVNLTITATTMSFSVNSSLTGTLSVAQGATTSAVNLTVTSTSTPSFIVTSGTSTSTALPLSYSCSGLPSESTCNFSPGSPSSSASVSFTIKTTAPTAELRRPLDGGARIFYAVLLPGLFGIMFTVGSRKRSLRGMRLLGLIVVLGFSTLWLSSCSGSSGSGNSNPGTPKGTSTVTLNATTGGTAPIASSVTFQFTVD